MGIAVSDRKHEGFDRNLVPYDEKHRIIDLLANPFIVPDVDWDAQPVRYFMLNEEWCKILAGWLDYMESISGWANAEDESHRGIQGFLEFEVGIEGGIFMSPEEFYDANKRAIYDAINDLAKQVVSGRTTGIVVDDDGNVVPPGETDGENPDDPETPQNEASEARSGGALAITIGYNKIWADMDSWYEAPVTVDVAQFRLKAKYLVDDAAADDFCVQYYNDRTAAVGHINSFTDDLSEMLFCDGLTKQVVANYIIDSITFDLQLQAFALNDAVTDAQIQAWYNGGAQIPSTDYLAYSCVPIETEELIFDMSTGNNVTLQTAGIWKAGHRFLIEVTGSYEDADLANVVGDGMYFHNTLTDVKTFASLVFSSSGGVLPPLQAEVPFSPTHVYRFTVDKSPTSADGVCSIGRDNGAMSTPNVAGILNVTITDLGKFA